LSLLSGGFRAALVRSRTGLYLQVAFNTRSLLEILSLTFAVVFSWAIFRGSSRAIGP
jgi:hypothetical protein